MDPSYLKYRFKKEFVNLLFCGLVAWKCHVCFFLCKDVKKKCPCVIYLYIHAHTDTHSLSHADLTVYFVVAPESPWAWKPPQRPLPPASVHTCKNRALIFLAIVQPFYSSKPYHESLHSWSLSISISHTQTQTSGVGMYRSDCFLTRYPTPLSKIEVRVEDISEL